MTSFSNQKNIQDRFHTALLATFASESFLSMITS